MSSATPGRRTVPSASNGRRALLAALAGAALGPTARRARADDAAPAPPSEPLRGRVDTASLASVHTGSAYALRLYTPPQATRAPAPIVYLLDAEWRLETLARIVEARGLPVRLAGVANEPTRNHDDMPAASCAEGGGGEAAFLHFLRRELVPFVESRVAVDPDRRALWGHSYAGAFVLYALFAEADERRTFDAYLVADPSIRCLREAIGGWEAGYAATHSALPVRLHYAYANPFNAAFAERIEGRGYRKLRFVSAAYPGGHDGMIPAAAADALAFAFA